MDTVKRNTLILLAIVALITVAFVAKTMIDASYGNTITIRRVSAAKALNGKPGLEVEVSSKRAFPATGGTTVLYIGDKGFRLGEFKNGDPHTLIFTLTLEEFAGVGDQDRITVRYDPDLQGSWDFGFLQKAWVINANQ